MVENLVPTSAAQWKGKVEAEGTDLLLPSTNVARVKQISPQAFLSSGLIPDPLTGIIRKAINTKKGMPPSEMAKIADDPEMLQSAMELFDRVLAYVMIEPAVLMPPTCAQCKEYYNIDNRHKNQDVEGYHRYQEAPRDPAVLYCDQVDMQDKMFIFNWCLGGTRDLERFRREQEASMDAVSNSKVVRRKAKQPAGRS